MFRLLAFALCLISGRVNRLKFVDTARYVMLVSVPCFPPDLPFRVLAHRVARPVKLAFLFTDSIYRFSPWNVPVRASRVASGPPVFAPFARTVALAVCLAAHRQFPHSPML